MARKHGEAPHRDRRAQSASGGSPSGGPTSPADPAARLNEAVQLHVAGRLSEAEAIYRQILQKDPDHAGAWHLLGVLACQVGQHAAALEFADAALDLQPGLAAAWGNRGAALSGLGRYQEAR
jgi:tetratricopeptide (TPR) repeat protein